MRIVSKRIEHSVHSVPFEDIIANVESRIRNLQEDVEEKISTETARILPADKETLQSVVMNTENYDKKIWNPTYIRD